MACFTANSQEVTSGSKLDGKGINFETRWKWQEVLENAKKQNKYIFVDFFATWCGPCKLMDKEVFPTEKVGEFINRNFISVKVQIDTSQQDSEAIRKWYDDAHFLKETYKLKSVPTFLFFSPSGEVVHKFCGALRDTDFLKLAKNSLDPDKQYYTLIKKFHNGKINYAHLPNLAFMAKRNDDKDLANIIAADYITSYLDNQNESEYYSKRNIEFVAKFLQSLKSHNKIFKSFLHHPEKINQVLGTIDFAQNAVRYIITKEEIDSKLWPNNTISSKSPSWNRLFQKIAKKYNAEYAARVILEAQIRWYEEKKDWNKLTKYTVEKFEKFGLDTAGFGKIFVNNMIYKTIFQHSTDDVVIDKAIKWMELIIKSEPNFSNFLDTYANLLYKIGRVKDAIVWEEKALRLKPDESDFQSTLEKMKKGQPTW